MPFIADMVTLFKAMKRNKVKDEENPDNTDDIELTDMQDQDECGVNSQSSSQSNQFAHVEN